MAFEHFTSSMADSAPDPADLVDVAERTSEGKYELMSESLSRSADATTTLLTMSNESETDDHLRTAINTEGHQNCQGGEKIGSPNPSLLASEQVEGIARIPTPEDQQPDGATGSHRDVITSSHATDPVEFEAQEPRSSTIERKVVCVRQDHRPICARRDNLAHSPSGGW
jgi:hypothetical protein